MRSGWSRASGSHGLFGAARGRRAALSTVARRGFAPFNVVTETDQHNAARDALATNAITKTAELTVISQLRSFIEILRLRSLIEISVAMFSNRRVSSSGLKLGVKYS